MVDVVGVNLWLMMLGNKYDFLHLRHHSVFLVLCYKLVYRFVL